MSAGNSNVIGEEVHRRLLSEGGFTWDHRAEGKDTITVHFNKGCSPSPELRKMLNEFGQQLKAFIFAKHDEEDRQERQRMEDYRRLCEVFTFR
jgi:hypothetical protein